MIKNVFYCHTFKKQVRNTECGKNTSTECTTCERGIMERKIITKTIKFNKKREHAIPAPKEKQRGLFNGL